MKIVVENRNENRRKALHSTEARGALFDSSVLSTLESIDKKEGFLEFPRQIRIITLWTYSRCVVPPQIFIEATIDAEKDERNDTSSQKIVETRQATSRQQSWATV